MGGIWAQVDIRHQYDEEQKGKRSPFWIDGLKPIQLATFDLEEYRAGRNQFTTDEWIDLLLRTIGLEPSHFSRRQKLHYLLYRFLTPLPIETLVQVFIDPAQRKLILDGIALAETKSPADSPSGD
jgi:predicted ATP-dependent Lon-type protease